MAELNMKQIADKLNAEFTGEARKLVFWYDEQGEFREDVESLELQNAKVLYLQPDQQFKTKYFLEREDRETNYLIYSPYPKPALRDNHLADMLLYSKEFFADRASMVTAELNIDERYKHVIQQHIKFFQSKERMQKFNDLELDSFTPNTIEIGLLSVLSRCKTASFEEMLRCVLTDGSLEDNKFLSEFQRFDLLEAFWNQVELNLGYSDPKPSLMKLVMTMFITYAERVLHQDIPAPWASYVSPKGGSIIVFMDNLMNSVLYAERFDELSACVYPAIHGNSVFGAMEVSDLMDCQLFAAVDLEIIHWIVGRLENEDVGAKTGKLTIPELCAMRRKLHFGHLYTHVYFALENAYAIIADGKYQMQSDIKSIARDYMNTDFCLDMRYRYFYYHYDQIENTASLERLRDLVERIYTGEFLNKITVNWTQAYRPGETGLDLQRNFFMEKVNYAKERTVVIISDAMRYEVAHTLYSKLLADEKCTVTLGAMEGVLPSYTPLGMASLLPHKRLTYSEDYQVLIDGQPCATTQQREALLQKAKPNSRCVQFDALSNMKQDELRSVFTGQDVVYVYHNQIDARGDAAKTENEVFTACEEAVNEIYSFIRKISSAANSHHFFVTADHGFIYKRDKLAVSDKIASVAARSNVSGQRYAISETPINASGVCSTTIGDVLDSNDPRTVAYPMASDIFSVAGAGQNFVHGGCSPQELLVPLVEVKVERGKKETTNAQLNLVSLTSKITNLITSLDFVQTEPVSDVVKKTTYRIYFVSETGEVVSNEILCQADKKDEDTAKRMFRFRFTFKNKQYSPKEKHYLVVYDDGSNMELFRREMMIDIAFAGDFGF